MIDPTRLSDTVVRCTSWKAVGIALGLKPTNASGIRKIRQQGINLGLDTSHFTAGRQRWTTRQLERALSRSCSWGELVAVLGLRDGTDIRARITRHAQLHGLEIDGLGPVPKPSTDHSALLATGPSRTMVRVAAPAIAMAWFAVHGVATSLPSEPQPYDLLAALSTGIQRVQVKSTTRQIDGQWVAGVGRRPHVLGTTGSIPYEPGALDSFFIVCGDGVLYLLPAEELAGRTTINPGHYRQYRVGDASSLLTGIDSAASAR